MQFPDGDAVEILGKTALNDYIASQQPGEYTVEKVVRIEPVENALYIAKQSIKGMIEQFNVHRSNVKCYLTGNSNFRKERATILPYKANRSAFDKPVHLQDVREYLIKSWGAEVVEGAEADDAIGIEATTPSEHNKIICSFDKDLMMIPGTHWNWVKSELEEVDEITAWYNFYKQMLMGDRTDNIPGIEGVGEKTAEKLLAGYTKPETMWAGVFQAYFNHYGFWYNKQMRLREALQEIGDLLWIQRFNQKNWTCPE